MDYFNKSERERRVAFAAKRDRIFTPVVRLLDRMGASPNLISLLGILFLLVACTLSPAHAMLATSCMAMYLLCDGLDGPLARLTGRAHAGGSLVDIIADQLGVVFLPAAAIYHLGAWGPGMVLFSAAYLMFIGLVVYANELKVKVRPFIRTKYLFFLLYLVSLHLQKDLVSHFGGVFGVYYLLEGITVLRGIYTYYDQRSTEGNDIPYQD